MNSNLQNSQSYKAAPDIVARNNQDGTVIVMRLDESSLFYKINGLAAQVWTSLGSSTDSKSVSQVVGELTAQYPQFAQQLQQDIPKFVSELVDKKLVIEV